LGKNLISHIKRIGIQVIFRQIKRRGANGRIGENLEVVVGGIWGGGNTSVLEDTGEVGVKRGGNGMLEKRNEPS